VSCQRYSVISKEPSQLRNLRFLPAVEMTFLDWHDTRFLRSITAYCEYFVFLEPNWTLAWVSFSLSW
jgi:hypothetical protein